MRDKIMTTTTTTTTIDPCIEYYDHGPDTLGRRRFTLYWTSRGGVFRPDPSVDDGQPVGYRRAQCFFCDPSRFADAKLVIASPWVAL